jgi:hypothetical protein
MRVGRAALPRPGLARRRHHRARRAVWGVTTDKQRAEDRVKEAERVVQDAAARAGGLVVRFVARAREEIEDVWAEAQSRARN